MLAQADLPEGHGQQAVTQLIRVFPVGGSSGWHTHPGLELGHVLSGVTEMRLGDGTSHRYAAGESFAIPRGTVHNGVNVGRVPARLLITYVTDKGAPQRTVALADVDLLATLPRVHVAAGLAEAVKHGVIRDESYLAALEAPAPLLKKDLDALLSAGDYEKFLEGLEH